MKAIIKLSMIQTTIMMNEKENNLGQLFPRTRHSMLLITYQLFITIIAKSVINDDAKSLKFSK